MTLILKVLTDFQLTKTIAQAIGFLVLFRETFALLKIFFLQYLSSDDNIKHYREGKNNWAVITGATSGIGKSFAFQLAEKGFNLLIIGRSQDILFKKDIRIKVECFKADLSNITTSDLNGLRNFLSDKDVTVLINNAGVNHDYPVEFTSAAEEELENIVNVNIMGVVKISRAVLPQMIRRQDHKSRCLVLNVSSFTGFLPSPLLATYSGSKAFLHIWSVALGEELRPYNIKVQSLNTGFVVSKMSKIWKPSFWVPDPDDYVSSVLRKVDTEVASDLPYITTPYFGQSMLYSLVSLISRIAPYTGNVILRLTARQMRHTRKRALRKLEKLQKGQ